MSKECTGPVLYYQPPPIQKSVARTSKGDLFGLILLIFSTFHYFPWDNLRPVPQAKCARGEEVPRPCPSKEKPAGGGGRFTKVEGFSFTQQTLRTGSKRRIEKETPKQDKRESLVTDTEAHQLGGVT
jgi:hypothetical protein